MVSHMVQPSLFLELQAPADGVQCHLEILHSSPSVIFSRPPRGGLPWLYTGHLQLGGFSGGGGVAPPSVLCGIGLFLAKNKNLMVMARAKCRAITMMSSTLLVWRSVADKTGYRFLSRKTIDTPSPTATKTQLSMSMVDQLMSATGIQIRLP